MQPTDFRLERMLVLEPNSDVHVKKGDMEVGDVVVRGDVHQLGKPGKLTDMFGCYVHGVHGPMFSLPVGPVGSTRDQLAVEGLSEEASTGGHTKHRVIQLWGLHERVKALQEQVLLLTRENVMCHRIVLHPSVTVEHEANIRELVHGVLERVSLACYHIIR